MFNTRTVSAPFTLVWNSNNPLAFLRLWSSALISRSRSDPFTILAEAQIFCASVAAITNTLYVTPLKLASILSDSSALGRLPLG